jgi:spore maturation protein SpmA|tara:strand:- start:1311 stop:1496 length:186 start_codon:yes stop_codon:yes gene_type:complete
MNFELEWLAILVLSIVVMILHGRITRMFNKIVELTDSAQALIHLIEYERLAVDYDEEQADA